MVNFVATALLLTATQAHDEQEAQRRLVTNFIRGPNDLNLPSGWRAPGTPWNPPAQQERVLESVFPGRKLASCTPSSDKYSTYSMMKWGNTDLDAITFSTPGFSATYKEASQAAYKEVMKMLGSLELLRLFYLQPGGTDADYTATLAEWCPWVGYSSGSKCAGRQMQEAKEGRGNWYLSNDNGCVCGKQAYTGAGLFIMPPAGATAATAADRAVHEYMHVYQIAAGGFPAWMMEGNAVLMECMFAPVLYSKKTAAGDRLSSFDSYQKCVESGGGGGGIVGGAVRFFGTNPDEFATKGEDRNKYDDGTLSNSRALYYDAGAMALIFAANHANKSVVSFVTDFYPSVVPPPAGMEGMADTEGWKKAFLDWTGFASMTAFYSAYKTFMTTGTESFDSITAASIYSQMDACESDSDLLSKMTAALADGTAYPAAPLATVPTTGWPYIAKAPTCSDGNAPEGKSTPGSYGSSGSGGSGSSGNGANAATLNGFSMAAALTSLALAVVSASSTF